MSPDIVKTGGAATLKPGFSNVEPLVSKLPASPGSISLKTTMLSPADGLPCAGLHVVAAGWPGRPHECLTLALPDTQRLRTASESGGLVELESLLARVLVTQESIARQLSASEFLLHALIPAPCVAISSAETALAWLAARRSAQSLPNGGEPVLGWDGTGSGLLNCIETLQTLPLRDGSGLCLIPGLGAVAWGTDGQAALALISGLVNELDQALQSRNRLVHEPPPFGLVSHVSLTEGERAQLARRLGPILRGVVARKGRTLGRFADDDATLNAVNRDCLPELVQRGAPGLRHAALRTDRAAWLTLPAQTDDSALRTAAESALADALGEDATDVRMTVWVPTLGVFVFAATAQELEDRVAAQASVLNIMASAEVLGGYEGYSSLRGLKLESRYPATKPLEGQVAVVTGGLGGIGWATARRLRDDGACVVVADRIVGQLADQPGGDTEPEPERYLFVTADLGEEAQVAEVLTRASRHWCGVDILVNNAGLSVGKSVFDTTVEDYDLLNRVMPRGSFLCSQAVARVLRLQRIGGDIVYICSKNALFAGPNNIAYGTAKAAQLHQARLLAAELAEDHVRVNVVNPDAVVRGSGIFSQGWGADRAKAYGISEQELGKFYASRSLLKEEMFPEDIAAAVAVLVGPELRKSTALVINVDSGFAPAMVR